MEKRKLSKKLSLNKEEIINLTNEEMSGLKGGNDAPTYYDPDHGGHCTGGCEATYTYGADRCTVGCTGSCPSNVETGCNNDTYLSGCAATLANICFTNGNCTYTQCTGGCPLTYGDATCTCAANPNCH